MALGTSPLLCLWEELSKIWLHFLHSVPKDRAHAPVLAFTVVLFKCLFDYVSTRAL